MQKLKFILIFITFVDQFGYGQEQLLKTYDFGTIEESYQIIQYNGRIFVNTATYCSVECSFLSEIDDTGTILWRTEVPDIDIASGTMIIINDTITVTGNNDPLNTAFRMAHFSLNGEKIGPTLEIEHPTDKYTNMFQLTTQFFAGKFVICGSGRKDGVRNSLIYVVGSTGELDTLITIEPSDGYSVLWESYIDNEGMLTTYHQVEFAHSAVNYRKIIKFDINFDTVWSYTSELNEDNKVIPRGCELLDGRVILSFVNPDGSPVLHSVRAINQDSTVDWQHDYPTNSWSSRYILRIKCLANGDIVGCGKYGDLSNNPDIYGAPWLFRMSPEGELIWERTYFDIDTSTMDARLGALFDFVELENGDILAVGYFSYNNDDMLVMRVDSNGCLYPENCNTVNIITGSEDLSFESIQVHLFPNPASSTLWIQIPFHSSFNKYCIFDLTGAGLIIGNLSGEQNEISISSLPSGVYLIRLTTADGISTLIRFLKAE